MTTYQYVNPFAQLQTLPPEERVYEETLFRLRLGEFIHRERIAQTLTMKKLAQKARTTPVAISRIEKAQVSAHLDVIFRIFKALGKTPLELFG